jgi:sialate O-acetylesterase
MRIEGDKIVLSFKHLGGGLISKDTILGGFAVAGTDREFVWAQAKIEGDSVIVCSPQIKQPVAVRYAWDDFPTVSLYNREGLPASPFRTDNF